MTSIEVCIVAYDNAATIDECIDSIAVLGRDVTLALADNHPEQSTVDSAVAAARRVGVPLRVIARPDNPGFGISCNALATTSTADWLLFLNPDASVREWPDPAVLRSGITAPRIIGTDGRREHSYGRRRTMVDEISRRLQIRPREPDGTGYVSGAAFLIRRAEFVEVGGFDERYFMYYEDIDLCRTVVERGGEVRIEPSFVVAHRGAHSASAMLGATALRSYESARQFHAKWSGTTFWIDFLVLLDSALRVLTARVGLNVPGAQGASSTLPRSWANVKENVLRFRRTRSGG